MEELFLKRLEELEVQNEEKKFMMDNVKICAKLYFRGIRDTLL